MRQRKTAQPRIGRGLNYRTRQKLWLITPSSILICVFSLYPTLRGILLGFMDYRVGRSREFNGIKNYLGIIDSGYLGTAFKNLLLIVVITLVMTYLIGLALALLLNSDLPLRKLWRTLVIVPWAIPPVARVILWRELFSGERGWINVILMKLGVLAEPVYWLSDSRVAIFCIITVQIYASVPFITLTLLSALQNIPADISEAAELDGASKLQYFRYVTLPYLAQTTAISMSLILVWVINDFATQSLLAGPGSSTLTPIVEAYQQGFQYGNFGYASAYGNIMILIVSVVVFIYLRNINAKDRVEG